MSEAIVICEGYHDRAFWKGWLMALGCTDPGAPKSAGQPRVPVQDDRGRRIKAPQWGLRSCSGKFIRIIPAMGDGQVISLARAMLRQRHQDVLQLVVLNFDLDQDAPAVPETPRGDVHALVKEFDPAATLDGDGVFALDGGETRVAAVTWYSPSPQREGLPVRQCLERVLCAGVVATFPRRGAPVESWLASRPDPPAPSPKAHSYSYMAGWYTTHGGYEAMCEGLWRDMTVRRHLEADLRATPNWRIAEELAG